MSRSTRYALTGRIFFCLLICFSLFAEAAYAKVAGSRITITQAKWAKGVLSVKGSVRHSTAVNVDVYDSSGRLLGQAPVDSRHRFTLMRNDLDRPELLCSVQAKATDATATVAVKGKPKSCAKVPHCKILSPVGGVAAMVNTDVSFSAKATLKDKKAEPLKMEWDFAGGSMGEAVPNTTPQIYHRPTGTDTTVQFVRDNGRYRVRFMAWDRQNRYCEDSVEVVVGTPPDTNTDFAEKALPNVQTLAQAAQQSAPAKGAPLQGQAGDWVVLPFQDWTMQNSTDAKAQPNVVIPLGQPVNNINAVVYEKGRQPMVVSSANKASLFYSASSNPTDPVGPDSINTTSRNWPKDKPLQQATVQKSDWFEVYVRPEEQVSWLSPNYYSYSYAGFLDPQALTKTDEGFHSEHINPDHGRFMPGVDGPYEKNEPQAFSGFDDARNHFAASLLPSTDFDDSGRINTDPLFRVEARKKDGTTFSTDLAISATRDMRCRACHLTGGIGSNPAYANQGYAPLVYHEAESDSLFDLEYAALGNTARLHSNVGPYIDRMTFGAAGTQHESRLVSFAGPIACANSNGGCHSSVMQSNPFGLPLPDRHGGGYLASIMHGIHSQFSYSDASKTDIVRASQRGLGNVEFGVPVGRDDTFWDPKTGSMPDTLFPVKSADGQILPMEDNCLLCHGGLREQSYRDRMYSAGVTCYQCHGGKRSLAGGGMSATPNPDGTGSRRPWIDEPDCGSCHTGNANRGPASNDQFYSAGVLKVAFDETDISATPRKPDPANPDEVRFAVPISSLELGDTQYNADGTTQPFVTKSRLYRLGKDEHGQIPCAACHGAAHGIWPMTDPNANDNLTSLELQGHAGPITECKVCHTADAFAEFADLDQGIRPADPKVGILGGPHNMHPVNDPNWWQNAAADTTPNQKSGKVNGGWHNDYAKIPGRTGEDQCAACHGNDHKGTRLSKTPVDRVFVNIKGKTVKVPAGTPIGCDLCHTIERSCTGSSAADCGQPSDKVAQSLNQKPVITSPAETHAVFGEDYHHTVTATDPEGHQLTYEISGGPETATISGSGEVTVTAADVLDFGPIMHDRTYLMVEHNVIDPEVFEYFVTVSDDQGAKAVQRVRVIASCPADLVYDMDHRNCVPVTITSYVNGVGFNAGETFRFQVRAQQRSGAPLAYSLKNQPDGMTIDGSGLLQWTPKADQGGDVTVTVTATGQTGFAEQQISLSVCAVPAFWDPEQGKCVGPIAFTTKPNVLAVANGDTYHGAVAVNHRDGLPVNFSLPVKPDGMTVAKVDSTSATIDWVAQAVASGPVSFTVKAEDDKGGAAQFDWFVYVCVAPDVPGRRNCVNPIQFNAWPEISGLSAGDTFRFQASASHAKNLPLTYSLSGAPAGMTIDPQTGQIDWVAVANTDGSVTFNVLAADNVTPQASNSQTIQLAVCDAGMRWDGDLGICQGPVVIDPIPGLGVDVGATLNYQVVASVPGNGTIGYGLADQPAGMSIDDKGLISWPHAAVDPNVGPNFAITLIASYDQGRPTMQYVNITVCEAPAHWNKDNLACE
ncbi:MAG: cadherin repeat domain-containing protein [Methylococcaceae bacterium]|nr:cadherin repeat domain-containing protein [Methylococcaceae bacterium]